MTPSLLAQESQLTPAALGRQLGRRRWHGETGAEGDSRSQPKVVAGSETQLPPPAVPPCATNTARREPGSGNRWFLPFFFFFFSREQPRLLAVLQFLGTCRAPMGVKSCMNSSGGQSRGDAAASQHRCISKLPARLLLKLHASRWDGREKRQFPEQQSVRPFAKQLRHVSTGRAALSPPTSHRG